MRRLRAFHTGISIVAGIVVAAAIFDAPRTAIVLLIIIVVVIVASLEVLRAHAAHQEKRP